MFSFKFKYNFKNHPYFFIDIFPFSLLCSQKCNFNFSTKILPNFSIKSHWNHIKNSFFLINKQLYSIYFINFHFYSLILFNNFFQNDKNWIVLSNNSNILSLIFLKKFIFNLSFFTYNYYHLNVLCNSNSNIFSIPLNNFFYKKKKNILIFSIKMNQINSFKLIIEKFYSIFNILTNFSQNFIYNENDILFEPIEINHYFYQFKINFETLLINTNSIYQNIISKILTNNFFNILNNEIILNLILKLLRIKNDLLIEIFNFLNQYKEISEIIESLIIDDYENKFLFIYLKKKYEILFK